MGQKDDQLFKALARMAERRLDQFNGQNFANTAWAFAVVNFYSDVLFGPEGGTAVEGAATCRRVVHKGFQVAGSCEHSVGVCHGVLRGGTAFHGIGSCHKMAREKFQSAGSYEHCMRVPHNWTEGRTFVHSVGQEGCQSMNTALSFYGVVQQEERLFTVLAAAAVSETGERDWSS